MGQAAQHYLLLKPHLEQDGHHALPVAGQKALTEPDECCSAGLPAPNRARAHAGGGRSSRRCKALCRGQGDDFSRFKLDLGEQDPFFQRIYSAARQVGWGRTTTYGALAKELGAGPEAARDVGQAMAKNPVALIIPCHRVWRQAARLVVFPRQAARRPRSACSRWRAFISSQRHRHSNL
jgi:O-6-methylguanine DNA methyltransferase